MYLLRGYPNNSVLALSRTTPKNGRNFKGKCWFLKFIAAVTTANGQVAVSALLECPTSGVETVDGK